jgi:hypothetical protein
LTLIAVIAFIPSIAEQSNGSPDAANTDRIIQRFADKETEFREARNHYTYRQTVTLQELDSAGNPSGGKWEEVSDFIFSPEGKRMEKVVRYSQNLQHLVVTPEDMQDLRMPFVMTTAEIPEYDVSYLGREKVDEIGCYTLAVNPRKMVTGKRYFQGKIWVDDRGLQIVKTHGKGAGITNGAFPDFETYREQIDGKYWFPAYAHADDTLHFQDHTVRIRITVKYQDYKWYEGSATHSTVRIAAAPHAEISPEMIAAARHGDIGAVEKLLSEGEGVNATSAEGVTALMVAAAEGQVGAVKALIQAGADAGRTTKSGKTALFFANAKGNTEIVTLLEGTIKRPNK